MPISSFCHFKATRQNFIVTLTLDWKHITVEMIYLFILQKQNSNKTSNFNKKPQTIFYKLVLIKGNNNLRYMY